MVRPTERRDGAAVGGVGQVVRNLALAVVIIGLPMFTGCGSVSPTMRTGVFAVAKGMTKAQVTKLAGKPYRAGPRCWLYHASKAGTSIDGMRFCFTNGRVSLVQTAVHG